MDIKYLGHASFFIKSKEGVRIITDPYDMSIGLKFPKQEADIVTVSHHHSDHDKVSEVAGNPLVIDWPGEFEKGGVRAFGYKTYHDKKNGAERGENIVFKIEADGINILHCGDMGLVPSDSFIDELGDVDILLIPVGGYYTIDAVEAVQVVKKIDPSIVIPMHFNRPGLNPEVFANVAPVETFLQEIGADNVVPVPKLTLKKEDLAEELSVVVMEMSK